MAGADLNKIERFAEELPRLFYLVMAVALLAVLVGSPGAALLLLILGAATHVVRAALEDFVGARRAEDGDPKAVRPTKPSPVVERPRRMRPGIAREIA